MLMIELFEARNHQGIDDPADRWLAKYTYENLDKWPSSATIETLLGRYPAGPGVIFRGINFPTKEQYDGFLSTFNGNQTTEIKFGSITSWTRDEESSKQFAVTQPTYFLNQAVMTAHATMMKNKEALSGYRGIILSMMLPAGHGIDVDQSGLGHESEIVLIPGKYHVTIHQEIRQYAHQLASGDIDIDRVIQKTTMADLSRSSGATNTFFDYVMHHHANEINDASRTHLFKLFFPKSSTPAFPYEIEPINQVLGTKSPGTIEFNYGIPGLRVMQLYLSGIIRDPRQISQIKKLARTVVTNAVPVIEQHIVDARRFDIAPLRIAARSADMSPVLDRVIKQKLGAEYQRLQDVGRAINTIRDPKKQQEAIKLHSEQIKALLSKIS